MAWLAAGALLGATLSTAMAEEKVDTLYRKLEILAEVLAQVESHYVDPIAPTTVVYGAAQGAVATLDGHSAFFTPEEYHELISTTEGEYAGIGIELSVQDGVPEIVAVFDGTPAHRAGLRTGDRLLAVEGASSTGMSVEAIQQLLRGPVGSTVVLSVRRPDREEPWSFTLVRSWIRVAPIERRSLGGGIEYVQIKTFARRVANDLEAALGQAPPRRGLVLDLRGNPGGLFDEAIAICDLFLTDGLIVTAAGKGGRLVEQHLAHGPRTQPDYRVAILIDGGSASAAEIVAGALRDRGRARLFGARSYGKASVQSILELSDGAGLKLTVARYLTPSGNRIEGQGIEPDEAVEQTEEGEDRTLAAAVSWLGG
jgi:carboxyl-terminal processing protease